MPNSYTPIPPYTVISDERSDNRVVLLWNIFSKAKAHNARLVDQGMAFLTATPKEALIKSFDKLRRNDKWSIPFVVSLSSHKRNRFVQRFPKLYIP
ncbi:hypothetical protein IVG45_08290 [Methylomonas sp. LL1]|nr:hypothetical protein IVG45_08290 [Methylomonas sp. LL1]